MASVDASLLTTCALKRNAVNTSEHLQFNHRSSTAGNHLHQTTSYPTHSSVITAMGAQQFVPPASPARVWVVVGASRGIGEQYVAQVRLFV